MIKPIADKVPACYGVCCPNHAECPRYATVETTSPDHTIATCSDGKGGWPLFAVGAAAPALSSPAPAQAAPSAVPEGYALVPVEPTPEMIEAARDVKRQRLVRAASELKQGKRPDTIAMALAVNEEWAAMLAAAPVPAAPVAAAPPKLIGWRTDDYLNETADPKVAKNWEVHYRMLPIFEGDPNTKLAAPKD